jgi:hypothetical protein
VTCRLVAVTVSIVLVLSACGNDGTAGSFSENPQPIEPDLVTALGPGDDEAGIPEVQRNFLTGCAKGFADTIPDLDVIQQGGLVSVCGCSYRQLVGYSYAEVLGSEGESGQLDQDGRDAAAFGIFTELENDLRAGETGLPPAVLDLIRTCIRSEAGL